MSETKLDFGKLDPQGIEYHRWVTDVENALTAKAIITTIQPLNEDLINQPTSTMKAQAVIIMRRHLDPALQWQYMNVKDPRASWLALEDRFGNVADTLLPDLKEKWNNIRFQDFKTVADFNSEMLKLRSMLQYCEQNVTEADMLEKTLSTFPVPTRILAHQYRNEVRTGNITSFNQLIRIMSVAEKHDSILVSNSSRPIGTKKIPEANYTSTSKGKRKEWNPIGKGRLEGRLGPQNHFKKDHASRGGHGGRGRGTREGRRGRGGYGGRGNPSGRATYAEKGKAKAYETRDKGENRGNCNRCGSNNHWYKHCKASKGLVDQYKAYREKLELEAYNNEIEDGDVADTNLNITDFKIGRDSIDETPDFD